MIPFGLTRTLKSWRLHTQALQKPQEAGVTAVVTSCNRHDLLAKTLESFFKHNTFPLHRIIVVEDGDAKTTGLEREFGRFDIQWISTGRRIGQIAAIDYAYSRITTPYIFHLEDDWEFYRDRFIENSLLVLRSQPECLQVWLRAIDDTNDHPLQEATFRTCGIPWKKLVHNHANGLWHGFSFNPGLRRFSDYRATNGYGSIADFDFNWPYRTEIAIGQFYMERNMYAAILCDSGGKGYVRHIGDGRKTPPPAS